MQNKVNTDLCREKLRYYIKNYYLEYGILFFTVLKFLLVNNLPAAIPIDSFYDDHLMIRLGNSLLRGDWLGSYDSNTLVKGISEPVFLVISNKLGISYNDALFFLYAAACVIFCMAMRYMIAKKWTLLLLYVMLLFNPASMDWSSYQRTYRCSLTPAQVLLVFGCFWGLYFSVLRKRKSGIGWAVFSGFNLLFFWNTREDSIWIIPFTAAITVLIIGRLLCNEIKTRNWKGAAAGVLLALLPVLILKCGNLLISYQNYEKYGIFVTNELNDSNFADAIKSIYAVKPEEEIQYVTVTRSKLAELYEISPTLSEIKEVLETCMDGWDICGRNPGDGEVEDGWFFWALRDAAQRSGYYSSAETANEFYGKIACEIRAALDEGLLEEQKVMPSGLMPPWRKNETKNYIQAVMESFAFLLKFQDTTARVDVSDINSPKDYEIYREFSSITRSPIYVNINMDVIHIAGWAFSNLQDEQIFVDVMSEEGHLIETLGLSESEDIAEFAGNKGVFGEAVKKCRFQTRLILDKYPNVYIRMHDSMGNEVFVYEDGTSTSNKAIDYCMDDFSKGTYSSNVNPELSELVERVNGVIRIYQKYNVFFAALAVIFYILMIFLFILHYLITRKEYKCPIYIFEQCMILTSLIASLTVLIFGVSYNHAYSCPSINAMYYSGAYSLILTFEFLSFCFGISAFKKFVSRYACNLRRILWH